MTDRSRVVRVAGPGKVEIIERTVPELDLRDILARVQLAGICGTDVHLAFDTELTAGRPPAYPFNLGHEAVCHIAALGRDAPRRDALGVPPKEGDRIVAFGPRCGECYFCRVLESQGRRVALERVVTHEFPLSRIREALETARREECVKAVLAPGLG